MPTIAEIERNSADWSKQYTQDGRLVYVNKKTGKKVSRRPSVEERAHEIASRNKPPSPSENAPSDDKEHGAGNTISQGENIYVQQYTIDRTPFFMHLYSGEVMWFLPRGTLQSAVKYITHVTETGVPYYENVEKKATQWTLPLEKMTSLARKNASTYRKYSRPQVEEKLHISYEDARRESYLAASGKKGSTGGAAGATSPKPTPPSPEGSDKFHKSKKSPEQKTPSKYHNIASADFNNVMLKEKDAAAASRDGTVEGLFGSGQERGKPLVRIVFERYDKNKDGFVDTKELQDLCYDFGSFLHESELISVIDRFDTSNTGSLNYIDFIVWWRNTETFSDLKITDGDVRQRSAAAEIFKRYDDKRIGYITRHQFRPLHAELVAAGLTTLTVDKCLHELDENNDGFIQFNEFIAWLDKSRNNWEGSSKNVARKLSTFKSSGPTLKKLFGDLMTNKSDDPEDGEAATIAAKDHPDYAKYFRMVNVGADTGVVMAEMKEQRLDPSLLHTPHMMIPMDHKGAVADAKEKEASFTSQFKRAPKVEEEPVYAEPPPVPDQQQPVNLFTYDPSSYIYTSISKPLGISLGENVPECAMGVYVERCNEGGKAEATGLLYPGLVLISVCGVDVQAYDFDSVMDLLRNAPSDEPVDLVFADPTMAVLNEMPEAAPPPIPHMPAPGPVSAPQREDEYEYEDGYEEKEGLREPTYLSNHDSFMSAADPFGDDDDSFSGLLEKQRVEEEEKHAKQQKKSVSHSNKAAAAAVLKVTARRKFESMSHSFEEPLAAPSNMPSLSAGVFGLSAAVDAEAKEESLFKTPQPDENSVKPPTVTRVSSIRRGRNFLKEAMQLEGGTVEAIAGVSSTAPSLLKADSSLDVDRIMTRAKAPPKRAPSDIRDETSRVPSQPVMTPPPPPKPTMDMLDDALDFVVDEPKVSKFNPIVNLPDQVGERKNHKANSASSLTFTDNPMKKPPPISTKPFSPNAFSPAARPLPPPPPQPPKEETFHPVNSHDEFVPVAPSMVVFKDQSSFNPVSKKPMSVFTRGVATATPSAVIDPYLREKYGGVPLSPPEHISDPMSNAFDQPERHITTVAMGCQTDYSAFIDAEYQTSYQMLLGEKAEVQAILARVRAEELAANARIQRAEDESFRRCQEREVYLSEMLELEEQKAHERIALEEERLAKAQEELEEGWTLLQEAEHAAKIFHNKKMNDLTNIASSLAQHHKKLMDDKRKVGKQRLSLDLAMRDINNYTHFSPYGQDNIGHSTMNSYNNAASMRSPIEAPPRQPSPYKQQVISPLQSPPQGSNYPAYSQTQNSMYSSSNRQQSMRNHTPGQGRVGGISTPKIPSGSSPMGGGQRSLAGTSGSVARPKTSRSRQIDYRNL